jgi:HSP90 family molecular chaperone
MMEQTKIERVKKEKSDDDEAKPEEDDGAVKDEDGEKKEEDEFEDKQVKEWTVINENKPIWTRKSEDITEEEYNKFYKSLTKDYDDPMYYTHFSAEGEVEFKALLFVPGRAPYNVFDTSISHNNIRLYVRCVFITDEFKDLLPRYLNFIKGVVDSDDLPLHVSREVLQESRILKIIKKKLVRKALTMLQDIADNDKKLEAKGESDEEEDEGKPGSKKQTEVLFPKFWEEFGKNLRLGMIEDGTNRARLTKLLRYKSSKSEDKLSSLEEYVERMPESQKSIFYLSAESIDKIQQSPVLEDAKARDIEVLYMVDAIDEYVVGHVTDFGGKKLVNLAKAGVKLEDKSKRQKKIDEKRKEKFEPLTKWVKDLLGDKVGKVSLTGRKTADAFILANSQYGVSARMAGITKAQTLGEKQGDMAKGELEINHLHPLVDEMNKRVKVDEKDPVAEEMALVLFDTAALQNGFEVTNTLEFGRRISRLMRQSVDIARDAPLLEEDTTEYEVEIDEEEAKEAEDSKEAGEEGEEKKEEL